MPAKTILTLLFLISLCVVVILGLRALPRGIDVITASSKDEILVAATALPGGTLLRAKDVAWKHILGVVQNVRVLAIDPLETRPNGAATSFGRTVTLEVMPDQAEKVNVAAELGKLSLTLRSVSATNGAASTTMGLSMPAGIKPIWAGDV